MSYCRQEGKDKILFVTKEDHEKPSTVQLPEDTEGRGLILPNGEINWNCPCLGGMASGPCGFQFREAFSCFHYSKEENKGSDCFEKFFVMQECMSNYPNLYPADDDDDEKRLALKELAEKEETATQENGPQKDLEEPGRQVTKS